jgi:alkylation response protein AidB-like acyl-CoA dehydrogenase
MDKELGMHDIPEEEQSGETDDRRSTVWRTVDATEVTERLEDWLGDPDSNDNSVSFTRSLNLDEVDELPADGIRQIRSFGFPAYFVPERLGGKLSAAEDLFMMTRVVARRDMNVAISESTQLWMMLAWIGGDADQQTKNAASVLRGGVIPCLAYSETAHGADLAANEFLARPKTDGYTLNGEKWPINRGSTSTHVVLLGDTGNAETPAKRRQSLFLVDRSALISGHVRGLARVPTYGLRGCDISGVSFDDVRVAENARIGAEGEGLELALRGLLITRTFCTGLSLGAGDTMLRKVGSFLSERTLYDGPASEIPYVSESLANSYLSMLVAECESLVATRGLHLYTEEFSTWANLAKVQVTRLIDFNSKVLSRTLGARYYMRAAEHVGIFQKMLRDSSIVSVFDGSEPVCLDSIALQLSAMATARRLERDDDWRSLYDLRAPLPPFQPERVSVFGRGRDATFASLPALVSLVDGLTSDEVCDEARLTVLREQASGLQADLDDLFGRLNDARRWNAAHAEAPSASSKRTSPQLLRLAEDACALHAKVAALGVWLYNRDYLGDFFAAGDWLQAALSRRQVHQFEVGDLELGTAQRLFTQMNLQRVNGEYFSIRRVRQARSGAKENVPS